MNAKNIFELIKGEKEKEDQLSAAFAFLLAHNSATLRSFLKSLGIKHTKKPIIETQRTYTPSTKSRIDIHIALENEYLIILESKVQNNTANRKQLQEYSKILIREKSSFKHRRLVLVTQTNQKEEFYGKIVPKLNLKKSECYYFRWSDLLNIWKSNKDRKMKIINSMFEEFVGDEMEDAKHIEDKKVGELKELMVFSANKDFIQFHLRKKCVQKNMKRKPSDCQYVAIYQTNPVKAVTHFGRVTKISDWFPCEELYKGTKHAVDLKWGHEKVFFVDKFVELVRPIPLGKNSSRVRRLFYSSMSKLLCANTTDDLL